MSDPVDEALQIKRKLRLGMAELREKQQDVDLLSRQIWEKMLALPQFAFARTIMTYLDIGNEVRTRDYLPELWNMRKKIVIPYCMAHELHLFHLTGMDELTPGMWQILEPKPQWRTRLDRQVNPTELDLIVVPGAAFDSNGDRLGLGKGYYDRFLHLVRPDALKVALAFECQMVEKIPVLPHDIRMDMVITEKGIYGS